MAQTTQTAPTTSAAGGKTTIVDPVISKIAGLAARDVPGVFALGSGAARVIGTIREAIGTKDLAQGVKVEVGETEVAADVIIIVEYPQPLQVVAEAVRAAVTQAIEEIVGMLVAEVNVTVADVHIPGDDDVVEEARVQ
ncbi:Asp23/Gls24 family envelope stress response protein [Microbacterium sp. CJ88]|uniref:Asp23/Gls24 family envelope stress response protein n=1 Tax=Microbacterium sp. CJ88 TaxID=3445672 RepID=UPI003F6557C9